MSSRAMKPECNWDQDSAPVTQDDGISCVCQTFERIALKSVCMYCGRDLSDPDPQKPPGNLECGMPLSLVRFLTQRRGKELQELEEYLTNFLYYGGRPSVVLVCRMLGILQKGREPAFRSAFRSQETNTTEKDGVK